MRFDILAWLLVPLGVTLIALLVVAWRSRPRSPADAHDGMAELVRFREAMAKPLPRLDESSQEDRPAREHASRGPGSQRGAA